MSHETGQSAVTTRVDPTRLARAAGRRFVLLCGVVPAVLTVALALARPPFLTQLDRRVYDGLLQSIPATSVDGRVVIVDIDERSLAVVGQWPWRREVVARLVAGLREMGASVVALDMVFAEPDRFDATTAGIPRETSGDVHLADAIRNGGVVLGYALTFNHQGTLSSPCLRQPLTLATVQPKGSSTELPAFHASGAICNVPLLTNTGAASGFLNALPDPDGMLRRVPLLIEYGGHAYPSLALAAVMAATDAHPVALRTINLNAASLSFNTGDIWLDGRSNVLLRYRGASRSFPYLSAADVLDGKIEAGSLKHALVFVGATALGTRDAVTTPFDTQFPGVEVHATVADNLLRRDFIARVPDALTAEMAAVLGLGIAITLLVARLGLPWGGIVGGLALLVIWRGAVLILSSSGQYFSPLFPAIGLLASLGSATLARLAHERRRADRSTGEKDAANRMMVQSLLSLTEIRDAETGNHSRRTQQSSPARSTTGGASEVPRLPHADMHRPPLHARAAA